MGNSAQKRLLRKLDLELFLSQIKPYSDPKANLEQYTVTEGVAATVLYLAAYTYNDVIGKTVLDLGCGTGRFALGASLLEAEEVVGIDIDKTAVDAASMNSELAGLRDNVQWVLGDIDAITGKFDTVLQNPPFGVQKRSADRRFLEKALEVGDSIYSLHNHPTLDRLLIKRLKASGERCLQISASAFIGNFVENHGGRVKAVYALLMTIPRMFSFHTKSKHDFVVDLYVINRKN
ncbi:MAG TPA: METTL5 family protein [Candidatus Bathyarchaeia archaeon]